MGGEGNEVGPGAGTSLGPASKPVGNGLVASSSPESVKLAASGSSGSSEEGSVCVCVGSGASVGSGSGSAPLAEASLGEGVSGEGASDEGGWVGAAGVGAGVAGMVTGGACGCRLTMPCGCGSRRRGTDRDRVALENGKDAGGDGRMPVGMLVSGGSRRKVVAEPEEVALLVVEALNLDVEREVGDDEVEVVETVVFVELVADSVPDEGERQS